MAKASEIIKLAQSWIGKKEADGSHRSIIDIYNSHKPLARGYAMQYTDAWCATFISALAIKLGCTNIIPTECGCGEMVALFQKLGVWVENDAYTPKAGDIIFYDWQDSGSGDNKGWPDHVGLVEKVSGKTITVIEGNVSDAVGRRTVTVNAKNIRGYAVPKYDAEAVAKPATQIIKAGTQYSLKNTPVYNSETGKTIGNRTGTYFTWDAVVRHGRIRMTNTKARVGVSGQVSFWVDVASLK